MLVNSRPRMGASSVKEGSMLRWNMMEHVLNFETNNDENSMPVDTADGS